MKKIIVSVLGHDRPGIIAAVSEVLFRNGCNIEDVSQTILQTAFAGAFHLLHIERETGHGKRMR